jgi:hypothetical protein
MTRKTLSVLTLCAVASAGACGADALLGPDAAQGIEGIALLGPTCPVQTQDEDCADRPYQAWITVRDAEGDHVTRVRSGEDGRFRVGLVPGRYTLDPEDGDPFPTATDQEVDVLPGSFTEVVVSFDTGIRGPAPVTSGP